MKLAVIGSRKFDNYDLVCEILSKYNITQIISGGAKGADSLAARYAKEHNIFLVEHIPNWEALGKKAGHIRNQYIIDECDRVVAFWDMKSTGTRDSINKAKRQDKPIEIVNVNEYQNQLTFG
jgi:hypothetical protein